MALDDGDYTLVAENAAEDIDSNAIQLEYEIKLVQSFPQTQESGFMGTPSLKPESAFRFNLSGKSEDPSYEILLYNDGTDRSNCTLADMDTVADGLGYSSFSDPRFSDNTVETVPEQTTWLKEYINNHAIPVTWRLYGGQYTDRVSTDSGTPVVINRVEPRPNPNRPNETLVAIQLGLGRRLI